MQSKKENRIRRHKRIRSKLFGTSQRPRLCVARSANHIYAQLINDEKGQVLMSASDKDVKVARTKSEKATNYKMQTAFEVGKAIAKKASEKKIDKVVFDRGGIVFHGRVKSLADGAREGGLQF